MECYAKLFILTLSLFNLSLLMQGIFRSNAVKKFWQQFHPYCNSSAVERIKFCVSYRIVNYLFIHTFVSG